MHVLLFVFLLILTDWVYQGFFWCPWAIHQWFLPTGEGYEKPLCQKCVPLAKVENTKQNCMPYQHGIWHEMIYSTCMHACALHFTHNELSLVLIQISCYSWSLHLKAQGILHIDTPTAIVPLAYTGLSFMLAWCGRAPTADDTQHDSHPDGSARHHQGLRNRTQDSQPCSKRI